MSNWHIEIADCTEAQKERLKQVYGYSADSTEYFGIGKLGVTCFWLHNPKGELITPDEAFERLGLNVNFFPNKTLLEENEALCKKIKELEQQLAAKPFSKLDWSIIDPSIIFVTQHRRSGEIYFQGGHEFDSGDWQIIATRPKPKYTPEQIEAVKDFDAWISRRHKLSGEFNWWLKEVNDD